MMEWPEESRQVTEASAAATRTPCVQLNTVPLRALIRPPTCSSTKSADTTTILTRRVTSLTYIPEVLIQAIYSPKYRDEFVSARLTLSGLERLGGCIAAEANHIKNQEAAKSLDAVFQKIKQLNLKCCDEYSSIQETSISQLTKNLDSQTRVQTIGSGTRGSVNRSRGLFLG